MPKTIPATAIANIVYQPPQLYLVVPEKKDLPTYFDFVQKLASLTSARLINVSLELSKLLLEVPIAERTAIILPSLKQLVTPSANQVIMLDKLEILFEPSLKSSPLDLLKAIGRKQVIIVVWPGTVQNGRLIYAEVDHPEYKNYPITDLTFIEAA